MTLKWWYFTDLDFTRRISSHFVQYLAKWCVISLAFNWHSSGICHIGRQGYLVYASSRDTPWTVNWDSSGICHIGRQGYLVYAYSWDTPLTFNWHSSGLCHIGRQRYLVYAYSRDTPLAFKWHFSGTKKWRAENSGFWLVRRPSENFQRGYPYDFKSCHSMDFKPLLNNEVWLK